MLVDWSLGSGHLVADLQVDACRLIRTLQSLVVDLQVDACRTTMNDDVRVLPTLHLDRSLKISTTALFNHFGVADADPAQEPPIP